MQVVASNGSEATEIGARPRVAIVVSNPIQHFCPFYRAIAETGEVDLRVIFLSAEGAVPFLDREFGRTVQWQPGLLNGFEARFLAESEPASKSERCRSVRRLSSELGAFQPDILINYGFDQLIAKQAFIWAVCHRRKILYISDSMARDQGSAFFRIRRLLFMPLAFRRMDGFLTVGDSNREFYKSFGARDSALFYCPFTVDENPLREAAGKRDTHRHSLLCSYMLPANSFIVLFVGKLNSRKRPSDLIEALRLVINRGGRNVHLVFVGDGPDGPGLRRLVTPDVVSNVHFAGFVPVTDLPGFLAGADLLAQPSEYDPHPLAISEALYCGLPVIASTGVGSIGSSDDVRPGVNGFCFDVGDVQTIAEHILRLASDRELCRRFRAASLAISETRSLEISVRGLLAAVKWTRNRCNR